MTRISAREAWDLATKLEAALSKERAWSSELSKQLRAEHERIGACGPACKTCAMLSEGEE